MKILENSKHVVSNSIESCVQGIAANRIAFATSILRDKIYTNKYKAAITEPVCNALDEHCKHKIKRPVDIFFFKKELCIRDYAGGLSDNDVMSIFFQFFESTKNNSNKFIGGFGLGAKAPGAYTSIYSIVSYFNGEKTHFAATKNGCESVVSKVYKEKLDKPETGICVRIPFLSQDDFSVFLELAKDIVKQVGFYKDNQVVQLINASAKYDFYEDYLDGIICGDDPSKYTLDIENVFKQLTKLFYIKDYVFLWQKNYYNDSYFKSNFWGRTNSIEFWAYDGNICYPLEVNEKLKKKFVGLFYTGCVYVFLFKPGELPIAPSRENIEVTPITEKWIESKLSQLSDLTLKFITDKIKIAIGERNPYTSPFNYFKRMEMFFNTFNMVYFPNIIETEFSFEEFDSQCYCYDRIDNILKKDKLAHNFCNYYKTIFVKDDTLSNKNISKQLLLKLLNNYFYIYGIPQFNCTDNYHNINICVLKDNPIKSKTLSDKIKESNIIKGIPEFVENFNFFSLTKLKDTYKEITKTAKADSSLKEKCELVIIDEFTNKKIDQKDYCKTLLIPASVSKSSDNEVDAMIIFCRNNYSKISKYLEPVLGFKHVVVIKKKDIVGPLKECKLFDLNQLRNSMNKYITKLKKDNILCRDSLFLTKIINNYQIDESDIKRNFINLDHVYSNFRRAVQNTKEIAESEMTIKKLWPLIFFNKFFSIEEFKPTLTNFADIINNLSKEDLLILKESFFDHIIIEAFKSSTFIPSKIYELYNSDYYNKKEYKQGKQIIINLLNNI